MQHAGCRFATPATAAVGHQPPGHAHAHRAAADLGHHRRQALVHRLDERADLRQQIPGWAPPARARLPFRSLVVASSDDPFGSLQYAGQLADDWGAAFQAIGACGHINADSGLGDWPEGRHLLLDLLGSPS